MFFSDLRHCAHERCITTFEWILRLQQMSKKKAQYEVRSQDHFRNRISSVDDKGKRVWMFPKLVKGRFYKYRTYVSLFLLVVFFAVPFIEINGHPFFMLNVLERKFVIFGNVFWPQDFLIFMLAVITFIIFIVLFTVIYGRLFCGWACPQTVFMEMVFRRIEYWIDGNHVQQRKLRDGPWNGKKIGKRSLKYGIYILLAFTIGNLFIAYIVGKDEMFNMVTSSPAENLTGFLLVMGFTGITFFNFAYFREQVCTVVCPYGRLQGVFLDKKSVVVAYDDKRGEPRELPKKNRSEDAGDCIDCFQCVDVCPTGIDIRNGTQLECVNCTACIDACDEVMDKVNKPRGLIRYASETDIEEGKSFKFNARSFAYSAVLLALLSVLGILIFNRSDFNTRMTKQSQGFVDVDDKVVNIYDLRLENKTFEDKDISLKMTPMPTGTKLNIVGGDLVAKANKVTNATVMIEIPKSEVDKPISTFQMEVLDASKVIDDFNINFAGPKNRQP